MGRRFKDRFVPEVNHLAEYEIGDQFVDMTEPRITSTISEKLMLSGIPHYKLSIEPNLYNIEPSWLSEYGILISFEPMGRFGRVKRKPKNPITAFLKSILG